MNKENDLFNEVSHATLRLQDLVPSFLERVKEFQAAGVEVDTDAIELAESVIERQAWDEIDADFAQAELFDVLDGCAMECDTPLYFGTHEGDGSLFGFWEVEEMDE